MTVTCTQLNVSKIRTDGGTQIRAELNQSRVEELAELLKEGHVFKDSIVVFYDGAEYWLGDGFHRVEATKLAGLATIDADVRSGTREDAIEHACGANATHGLPRKNEDKRNAVRTLLGLPKWQSQTQEQIARQCGVSQRFVSTILREMFPERFQNGSKKPINPPVEPVQWADGVRKFRTPNEEKRQTLEEFFADPSRDGSLSNREIAKRCGVDEGTVRNYKKALQEEQQRIEQELAKAENEKQRKVIDEFFADFPGSEELSDKEIAKRCEVDEKLVKAIKKELAEEKQRLEREEAARNASAPVPTPDSEPLPVTMPASEPAIEPEPTGQGIMEAPTTRQAEADQKPQETLPIQIKSETALEPEQDLPQIEEPASEPESLPVVTSAPEPEPTIEPEPTGQEIMGAHQTRQTEVDPKSQETAFPQIEPETALEPEQELPQIEDPEPEPEPTQGPEQELLQAEEPTPEVKSEPETDQVKQEEPAPINIGGIIVPSEETLIEREIKRQQTQDRNEQLRQKGAELPQGKYACLVVDPPWPMKKIERDVRPNQVDFDYPTMTEDELKVFPLPDMAGDDCHLYLWTTQKYLPMALRLAEHWGFKYQCLMTWVKNVGPTPFSWMYTTEHVLFCSKGSLPLLAIGRRLDFVAKGREHSRKPDVFYDLVREVSPGPRIDVFSREKREGFDQYGYEVEKYVSA